MEASHVMKDLSWAATRTCSASGRLLPFQLCPRGALQPLFQGFQVIPLLIRLLLLTTVHNQRQELLDCGSCHRMPLSYAGVCLVKASPPLSGLKSSSENDPQYHLFGATPLAVKQELPPSKSSPEAQPGLFQSFNFPLTSRAFRFVHQGTQEEAGTLERGYSTTVPASSAQRGRSEYAASAEAESATSGLTDKASEARSTLADSLSPGERMARTLGSTFETGASTDTPVGQSTKQEASDRLLGRKPEGPAISNALEEELLRQQLHLEELQAAWRLEGTRALLLNKFYSDIPSLTNEFLINASALPGLTLQHNVAGQPGRGISGKAEEQEPSHMPRGWLIGIMSCFVGAFCGSLGDNMVRKSFVVLNENNKLTFFQMWRSPLWSIGMFLTIVVNTLCSLVGLAFAPATVVTSFAGVHIFWNTLLAKTVNREKATVFDYVGIVAVIVGIVLIVIFSGADQAITSAQAFVHNLANPGPVAYIVSVAVLVAVGSAFDCCPTVLSCCRNVSASMNWNYERGASLAERFLLAVTSGACGGLSNLLAKGTILMFNAVPHAVPDVESTQEASSSVWLLRQKYTHLGWGACLMAALTGGAAATQLLFLNASLRKFEAIYVVPIINSVLIVMGALGGIVLFHEVPAQCAPFTLGVVSVVVGVTALSYGKYEAEQYLLQESQRKETALRNIGGREPGDPLLVQQLSSEVPLEENQRDDTHSGHISRIQRWCDMLFRPLTDASVNILVRTNTLNSNYSVGLLNIAHCDSNASIRLYQQATPDI